MTTNPDNQHLICPHCHTGKFPMTGTPIYGCRCVCHSQQSVESGPVYLPPNKDQQPEGQAFVGDEVIAEIPNNWGKKPDGELEIIVLPDIFRGIGPGDDVVVSTEKVLAWRDKAVIETIKNIFPHLWGEYNSFSDERQTLEQDDSFDSFFTHERVRDYLKAQLKGGSNE